jgi:hypothetical protein
MLVIIQLFKFLKFFLNIRGEFEDVTPERKMLWSSTWRFVNETTSLIETFLDIKLILSHLKGKFFHVWDDNH